MIGPQRLWVRVTVRVPNAPASPARPSARRSAMASQREVCMESNPPGPDAHATRGRSMEARSRGGDFDWEPLSQFDC